MQESDPRVSDLQSLAWGLQSLSSKPGSKIAEKSKRDAYSLASKALALCTDAEYTCEEDFVKRAAEHRKQIEARKVQLAQEEASTLKEYEGKCYRAGGAGTYTVGYREDVASAPSKAVADLDGQSLSSTAVAPAVLTADEVIRWCADDLSSLRLCGKDLKDSDMDALCRGLQSGGAELTNLDLSNNAIADTGVQRLVTALASKACPKLTDLWLGGNCFGPLGTQMLTGGLGALRRGLAVHMDISHGDQVDAAGSSPAISATPVMANGVHAAPAVLSSSAEVTGVGGVSGTNAVVGVTGIGGLSLAGTEWEWLAGADGAEILQAIIPLPDQVTSIQDLDLDLSADMLVVRTVAGECLLEAGLAKKIDPDSAKASFSRKRRNLKIALHAMGL